MGCVCIRQDGPLCGERPNPLLINMYSCSLIQFSLNLFLTWYQSLHAVTYLLNLLPTKAISAPSPHFALFGTTPSYTHLWVFGCACYPNTSVTDPHNLAPRSCQCVFLGYSSEHKGYRCLDLSTNRLLVSRHVIFDKSSFPFASSGTPPDDLEVLRSLTSRHTRLWHPSSRHTRPRRPRPRHA
jgi:hypothetical protein